MSITYQVMRVDISDFAIVLRYILHIFPPYSLTSALVHYFHIVMDRSFCNVMDHDVIRLSDRLGFVGRY